MTPKHSKNEDGLMAESLEGRLLYSGSPIDLPVGAAHEVPINQPIDGGADNFSFEPIDPVGLAALAMAAGETSSFEFIDGAGLEFDFVSGYQEVKAQTGDDAGVFYMAGPRGTSTLMMSRDPAMVFGLEEVLRHHSTVRVSATVAA